MRSIPAAMTWEMLSRGRWSLIASVLAANALPIFLLTALRREGFIDPDDPSQVMMNLFLVQISMFIFASSVFVAQGEPSRLFAFPIPTASLVAWQMLPAMSLVALQTFASTAALNALFDLGWPLWGPTLFVATAVAAVQAGAWWAGKTAWLPWTLGLVATVLGLWLKSRYGATFSSPNHLWLEVTPVEILTLLAFTAVSYYVAIVGVNRQRRGDVLPPFGIVAWIERVFDPAPKVGLPFRTPMEAQLWLEWKRKGAAMPAAVVFCLIAGIGFWLIFSRNTRDLFEGFLVAGGLLSVLGVVIGAGMGCFGSIEANYEMGHFLATRPMTNSEYAKTILKTSAKSVFVSWIIWAAAFLALYLILLATRSAPQDILNKLSWWYFPATLIGPWLTVMTVAAVGMAGRSQFFVQLFFIPLVPFFGTMISRFVLSHQAQTQLEQGLVATSGTAFVLGTLWAFVAARRRSLIGLPANYLAASVWVVISAIVVLDWFWHSTRPIPSYLFVVGLAALTVAPLATAPLALTWNRHR